MTQVSRPESRGRARPIIFSAPMVRALLDGRKTQTRRLIRDTVPEAPAFDNVHPNHKPRHAAPYLDAYYGERKTAANPRGMGQNWCWWTRDDRCGSEFRVGYTPGDRLWVKEGFVRYHELDDDDFPCTELRTCFRVDGWPLSGWYDRDREETRDAPPWKSPIYMPRALSRLTLLVTGVRVQRLQEITLGDICAEGLARSIYDFKPATRGFAAFEDLWNSLHGPDAWAANPWVVALTFTVEQRNIDAMREAA